MSWILLAYLSMLGIFLLGFLLSPKFYKLPENDSLPLSVIICARNEAGTIETCLQSLLEQDYDAGLVEVIIVNDASTDATASLVEKYLLGANFSYKVLHNETARGKKRSLAKAIALSKHPIIITRDADTFTESTEYLRSIAAFFRQEQMDVVIAPIALAPEKGLLNLLQNLENKVLRVFTAGSAYFQVPFISSGANFAFRKSCYEELGGYSSHLHIESGDDVFFLQEACKHKHYKIGFLNSEEALVYTYAANTLPESLQQRARWSGKLLKRPTLPALISGLLILITNVLFVYASITVFFHPQQSLIQFLVFKAGMDFFLLFLSARGFDKRASLLQICVMVIVYPFYMIASSLAAVFTKPRWK